MIYLIISVSFGIIDDKRLNNLFKQISRFNGEYFFAVFLLTILFLVFVNNDLIRYGDQRALVSGDLFVVHVSPTGNNSNDGSGSSPVATIESALSKFNGQELPGKIIVHGGTYNLDKTIEIKQGSNNKDLLISAAEGENPLFYGGSSVNLIPMEGENNVHVITGNFAVDPPGVWEENSKIRYRQVLNMDSLKYSEYGLYRVSQTELAIHPKGGVVPGGDDLKISLLEYGLSVLRNNVTVDGLRFEGFSKSYSSAGVSVGYSSESAGLVNNVILKNLQLENSYSGIFVRRGSESVGIIDCYINNVSSGINQWGGNIKVSGCKIYNNDSADNLFAFRNPDPMTGNTGLRVYYNSIGGEYIFNIINGFPTGIFIKTVPDGIDYFKIENNTIVDDPYMRVGNNWGVNFVRNGKYSKEKAIIRYNIIDGFSIPFGKDGTDSVVDKNIFWNSKRNDTNVSYSSYFSENSMGENIPEDPLFVGRQSLDFRIYSNGPAFDLASGNPAGALGFVKVDSGAVVAPDLRIEIPIIIGKQFKNTSDNQSYIVKGDLFKIKLFSNSGSIDQIKLDIKNSNQNLIESKMLNFVDQLDINLPQVYETITLELSIKDNANLYSNLVKISLSHQKDDKADIYTRANKFGFVVFPYNTLGGYQVLEYRRKGETNWIKGFDSLVYAGTKSSPHSDLRDIGEKPLPIFGLIPNTVYEYRILTRAWNDGKYSITESTIYEVNTVGESREYFISPSGSDFKERGSRNEPFKTLQYALDLSLPGDTIKLLPGVYFGPSVMFHSGTSDHPIRIEGEKYGSVILDARKNYSGVLLLSNISNVIVKNLIIQGGLVYGLNCIDCAFVEISNNILTNGAIGSHNIPGDAMNITGVDNVNIHHNLIYGWWSGVEIFSGLNTKFEHNTIVNTARSGLKLSNLSQLKGSKVLYNSIHFSGNHWLEIDFGSGNYRDINIDFNNFGTVFQPSALSQIDSDMKTVGLPYPSLYSNRAREFIHYFKRPGDPSTGVYMSMSKWKADTGYDLNSIYADPLWVDPNKSNFYLKSNSPNILGNKIIGALPVFNPNNPITTPTPPPLENSTPTPLPDVTPNPNPTPTPTPTPPPPPPPGATNGLCATTLNSCREGSYSDVEDTSTKYNWSCLGLNGGYTASCSLDRFLPPINNTPPNTNRPTNTTTYRPGQISTKINYQAPTINIPTTTVDISMPKLPSWLDFITAFVLDIANDIIRGVKRTGEMVGM